uniref:Cadherin domain-containing protein n=1 Tax=Rhabditophanes sp. KR3021 TaxID=114890 RepID=A0AC35TFY1_9BILA
MICILVGLFYVVGVDGFRKDFIWGVTSAAYSIEGGYISDGKGLSNWDYFTSKYMNETGNVTSDSYHNLNADLLLIKQLNVTHYKFSISWSRIFPQGTTDIINKKGLAYYKSLISGLKSLNIQPILTLLHYDLPLSLESIGGFQNDAIVPLFLSYASFILDLFKDDVKTWITIEDPFGMAMNSYGGTKLNWAPGGFGSDNAETTIYNAFYNILKCHGKVGQLFKAKYKSKDNKIGLSFTVNSPFPLDTKVTTTFDMYMDFTLGLLSSPIFSPNGNYPDSILHFFQAKTREEGRSVSRLRLFSIDEIKEIRNSSDFIGLNYFGGQLLSSGGKKEIQFNQIGKELGIEFVNDNLHLNKASYWPDNSKEIKWNDGKVEKVIILLDNDGDNVIVSNDSKAISFNETIIYGRNKHLFKIDEDSNLILIKNVKKYPLNVLTFNENTNQKRLFVLRQTSEIINNTLLFTKPIYSAVIEEKSKLFTIPVKVAVTNSHAKGVTFMLSESDANFIINPKNGILTVVNEEFLTIETVGEEVMLTITGIDKDGKEGSAIINIKIVPETNFFDRAPKFIESTLQFHVKGGVREIGKVEVQLNVEDGVVFDITEGPSTVVISPETGQLSYVGTPLTTTKSYDIMVLARNKRFMDFVAFARVIIKIEGLNSQAPSFDVNDKVSFLTIGINAKEQVLKVLNVVDGDANGKLEFVVDGLEMYDMLRNRIIEESIVKEIGQKFTLKENILMWSGPLSNGDVSSLKLRISVKDMLHEEEPKDYSELVIAFEDDGLTAKRNFLSLLEHPDVIEIDDELEKNGFVYQIHTKPEGKSLEDVKDNNERQIISKHVYRIVEGDGFNINSTTGEITVKEFPMSESLRIEVENLLTQEVVETSIEVKVIKKINEVLEESKVYNFDVHENVKVGTVIGNLKASNKDRELLGGGSNIFSINENNQLILQATLDYEHTPSYTLFNGMDEIIITIFDINDNEPVVVENNVKIKAMDNVMPGTILEHLNVYDPDASDVLTFTITENYEMARRLTIDKDQNIVTRDFLIDVNVKVSTFKVLVSDGFHQVMVNVELELIRSVECNAVFEANQTRVYFVEENTKVDEGKVVGQILAKVDDECKVMYDLVNEIEQDTFPFSINNATGEIILINDVDRETQNTYKLDVKISSGRKEKRQIFEVIVLDKNDHTPNFLEKNLTFQISENFIISDTITTILATDIDSNDKIFYHLTEQTGSFQINRLTGQIKLIKKLDREQNEKHLLYVYVTNEEFLVADLEETYDMMEVVIMVENENDNAAKFDLDLYEIAVPKNSDPGSKLIQLHSHDADILEGEVQKVAYEIEEISFEYKERVVLAPSLVTINNKGYVKLNDYLMDYVGGVVKVKVQSKDLSDPTNLILKERTQLNIWICDERHILNVIFAQSPMNFDYAANFERLKRLAEAVGESKIILERYTYYKNGDSDDSDTNDKGIKTLAKIIFISQSTQDIFTADNIIGLIDNQNEFVVNDKNLPGYKVALEEEIYVNKDFDWKEEWKWPFMPIIIITFILGMMVTILVFVYLIFKEHKSYQNERQDLVDTYIVESSKESNNIMALHAKNMNGEFTPNMYRKYSTSTFNTNNGFMDDYSVQTMHINVQEERSRPYIEELHDY